MIDLMPSTLMIALLLIEDGLTLNWANAHALFSAGLFLLSDFILQFWASDRVGS